MTEHDNIITIAGVERTFAVYERKVKALRGVDMQIPRGAFVPHAPLVVSNGQPSVIG